MSAAQQADLQPGTTVQPEVRNAPMEGCETHLWRGCETHLWRGCETHLWADSTMCLQRSRLGDPFRDAPIPLYPDQVTPAIYPSALISAFRQPARRAGLRPAARLRAGAAPGPRPASARGAGPLRGRGAEGRKGLRSPRLTGNGTIRLRANRNVGLRGRGRGGPSGVLPAVENFPPWADENVPPGSEVVAGSLSGGA